MASVVDLRTSAQKQGITNTQQDIQAIVGILNTIGQAEQVRQERQTLDRVTTAIANGATTAEAIAAVANQQPGFSPGLRGGLQKFAGKFQPPGGGINQGIQQSIISSALQSALAPAAKPISLPESSRLVTPEGQTLVEAAPTVPKPPTKSGLQAQEILRLQDKEKAGTLTNSDQTKLDKLLIGQPLVEIGLGKPASASERTAIAESRASIDALNNLKGLFKEEFVGPIKGKISPLAGLVGQTTQEQEAFMAATSAFKNMIIKQITGAQMSEPEAKRIMKQIPDITDPPARWKAKWEQSLKNVERIQKRRLQVLQQSGIRVPGDSAAPLETPDTTGGVAPTRENLTPQDLTGLSVEQLQSLLGNQ